MYTGGELPKPMISKDVADNGMDIISKEKGGQGIEGTGNDVKLKEPNKVKTNKWIEVEFTNPSGNTIKYVEQNPKNIPNAIESAKNSSNAGKSVEGKVWDFV